MATAAGAAESSNIKVHADWSALCGDPQVDVVDITLPTHLHAAATLSPASYGCRKATGTITS